MIRNHKVGTVLAAMAVLALVLGGVATASNMGFKFVPNVSGTVGANAFNLSLPWNNNYTKANGLLNDLPGALRVSRYEPGNALTDWTPATSPPAFAINKGEAYVVTAGAGGVNTAIMVGSHDPNHTLSFSTTSGAAFSAAAPYHQTFSKANQLLTDLNSQLGAGSILRVSKYEPGNTLTDWTPATSPPAFNLDLGMGVIVTSGTGGSGYAWPHY